MRQGHRHGFPLGNQRVDFETRGSNSSYLKECSPCPFLALWQVPENPFYAYRYEPSPNGKMRRVFRSFKNITEAKKWQQFNQDSERNFKTPKDFEQKYKVTLKKNESGDFIATKVKKQEINLLMRFIGYILKGLVTKMK